MIDLPENDSSEIAQHLRQRIQSVMRSLRAARPWPSAEYSEGGYFRIPINIGGKLHNMPLGFVGTKGCNWARSGGCTMCDYGGFNGTVPDEILVQQTVGLLDQWPDETEINLSALGSFFDDKELSLAARRGILAEVAKRPNIELIGVESRAGDVNAAKIKEARSHLGVHRCLEVGMGLESVNDFVRNVCINKGLSRKTFERAVKTIQDCGAQAVGHVLLKPPFLTEEEAINDAIATIEYLDALGVRRIVLMVCNVKDGTLVGELYKQGLYRPPWLWSVLRTALNVSSSAQNKLLIYGFDCGIPMVDIGRNCKKCSEKIINLMRKFSGTGEEIYLQDANCINCDCKSGWNDVCGDKSQKDIIGRIDFFLSAVGLNDACSGK